MPPVSPNPATPGHPLKTSGGASFPQNVQKSPPKNLPPPPPFTNKPLPPAYSTNRHTATTSAPRPAPARCKVDKTPERLRCTERTDHMKRILLLAAAALL